MLYQRFDFFRLQVKYRKKIMICDGFDPNVIFWYFDAKLTAQSKTPKLKSPIMDSKDAEAVAHFLASDYPFPIKVT
jgi:hypothetical protein